MWKGRAIAALARLLATANDKICSEASQQGLHSFETKDDTETESDAIQESRRTNLKHKMEHSSFKDDDYAKV